MAACIVLPILALLLTTVRVRVFFTPPALNRSAELVLVSDTLENRAWLEKIAQQTPFPEVGPGPSMESLSDAHLRAEARVEFSPGQKLREVEVLMPKPVFEQNWWWPPMENLPGAPTASPVPAGKRLHPRVRWLSSLTSQQLPDSWPDYTGPVDTTAGTRFLLEVNAEGRVTGCVSAAKESGARPTALENWLKRLRFPESKQGMGWLACEIIWEYGHD